ncbi:hypothetical protein [Streptomyces sp. H27-H5]|uniref:hypothetical protein n=1 Tax=Streptomyces sp. H27-H5 TaxID=2996460 RepID=UPI00226F1845|nr:hypothetical protein [Streptomyces sp. H27-H5]MCY0956214.1 hypothetical protein [Streptomyces sp. H27-H5]
MAKPRLFEHLAHPLLGQPVRDIASGTEGELTAVVEEEQERAFAAPLRVRLAYIRMASGREMSTAVGNIQALR